MAGRVGVRLLRYVEPVSVVGTSNCVTLSSLHERLSMSAPHVPYSAGYALQSYLGQRSLDVRRGIEGIDDNLKNSLVLLEHSACYTLGRRGDIGDILGTSEEYLRPLSRSSTGTPHASLLGIGRSVGEAFHDRYLSSAGEEPLRHENGADLLRVDRGGDVTFHGPGQLTCYPILDLTTTPSPFKKDLHWYLSMVEDVVIDVLAHFGIQGVRDERGTGVWVPTSTSAHKIAQVGIGCGHWITKHGFAINVTRSCMPFFSDIVPCGIDPTKGKVTCLADVLPPDHTAVSVSDVAAITQESFSKIFDVDLVQ